MAWLRHNCKVQWFDLRLMQKKSTDFMPPNCKQGIMCPLFEMQKKKKTKRDGKSVGSKGGISWDMSRAGLRTGELTGTASKGQLFLGY